MTPLIDVVFILLLFFMLSSTFADMRRIDLATPAVSVGTTDVEVLRVRLEAAGLLVNGERISSGELTRRIVDMLAASPDGGVVLKVGAGVPVGRLTDTLDRIRATGVTRFSVQGAAGADHAPD